MQVGEAILDERGRRREREQVGQVAAQRVADGDRSIRAAQPDVDMETERVVAPHDVAQQLVVAPVVGRVDDPLLLPRAPGVGARRAESDVHPVAELEQLQAPFGHACRRFGKALAAAGLHLDLRGDQLSGQVVAELAAPSGGIDLLEAIDHAERGRIEHGELLLDGKREVLALLELRAGERDLLVGAEALLVTHRRRRYLDQPAAPSRSF